MQIVDQDLKRGGNFEHRQREPQESECAGRGGAQQISDVTYPAALRIDDRQRAFRQHGAGRRCAGEAPGIM